MKGKICMVTEKQFLQLKFSDKEEMQECFVKLKQVAKDLGSDLDNENFEVYVLLPSKMNEPGFKPAK